MFQEKVVEYTPYLALTCHALSLGFRFGKIGCELINLKEFAFLSGVIAQSFGHIGIFLSFMDAGMMVAVQGMGFKEFFGDLASWTRTERLTAYMLTAANTFLIFVDNNPR